MTPYEAALLDFDGAGEEGTACYALSLSRAVAWPIAMPDSQLTLASHVADLLRSSCSQCMRAHSTRSGWQGRPVGVALSMSSSAIALSTSMSLVSSRRIHLTAVVAMLRAVCCALYHQLDQLLTELLPGEAQ